MKLKRKYKVVVIPVYKQKEKIRFQVKHPEDVDCITGIAITNNATISKGDLAALTLSIPAKGDVFFIDAFPLETAKHNELMGLDGIFKSVSNVFLAGKRREYFETNIAITGKIMEGYLESNSDLGGAAAGDLPEAYRVVLYLRYERKNLKQDCNDR